jgi:hypothetical protein
VKWGVQNGKIERKKGRYYLFSTIETHTFMIGLLQRGQGLVICSISSNDAFV